MKISLIVAMDENGLIGAEGGLPWRLPADLAHFKRNTVGKAILMGRKTHESIGRPLPERCNIVLTRNADFRAEGCEVVSSLEQARTRVEQAGLSELVIIGGAEIYRLCLPQVERIHLTRVHGAFEGDTWFPELDLRQWREVHRELREADGRNSVDCSFIDLLR